MKVFSFHLMPYAYLDLGYQKNYKSVWINYPNTNYDPVKGHELYNRYLDELELAAELGYDGICVNEHHQNAYGLMPSPVVMASALSRRTKDCKIAILGSAFCLREHPLTVAEEHAMIDVITGGRLISGFVRGIGAEYFSLGVNPALSHERHVEAHDLVVQAWSKPGPFAFEGKHYHFEYVNVWPRPYQQPHPKIWCPSLGSVETIEWACHPDRRYTYAQNYSPFDSVLRYLNLVRETCEKLYGYTASSEQVAWTAPIYVAETDERAVAECGVHMERLFNQFLQLPFELLFPPGYLTAESYGRLIKHKKSITGGATIQSLMGAGIVVVGSPETVRRTLIERHRQAGFGSLTCLLQFATLPRDLTEKNLRLFAAEVLPALKPLDDRNYAGFRLRQAAE
jgi:alkanesulfonate monooxygenase SsuD/methylene tetrahydromethanopterin reductase-like flavin-dependent oxidoreductase (luciferase family)